jgi:hypothetical protein
MKKIKDDDAAFKHLINNMRLSSRRRYHRKEGTLDTAVVKITREYAIEITPEQLKAIYHHQNGRCYWLGVPVTPTSIFIPYNPFAMSVDRLDTSKDYTASNCVITMRMANLGRGAATAEVFRDGLEKVKRQILENELEDAD